jgi:hypothetical protein
MIRVNFSFLPHMLQQQYLISNCFFFLVVFKNILVYVATVTLAPNYNWLIISCMALRGEGINKITEEKTLEERTRELEKSFIYGIRAWR